MKQRTIKIEESGDPWKKRIKPKIRLSGNWLAQAGFAPGGHVQIVIVSRGIMQLSSTPLV